jgi:hypothetical protein
VNGGHFDVQQEISRQGQSNDDEANEQQGSGSDLHVRFSFVRLE